MQRFFCVSLKLAKCFLPFDKFVVFKVVRSSRLPEKLEVFNAKDAVALLCTIKI